MEVSSMEKLVAVENNLGGIESILEKEGYHVVKPGSKFADAYVLSGMDNNVMNMQDIISDAKVIDARGKTPEEVLEELRKVFKIKD